ncbi:hypothetical protein MLD38_002933 [Melastoma candidum]|uniref:Uncharacterized protein n=1 Tax=Melastoma candidum TaxID=119954 RepID=A0ACB9S434_9MYRT|nr:hypothetical protein MLD38_002933 [Melastoma candidum]
MTSCEDPVETLRRQSGRWSWVECHIRCCRSELCSLLALEAANDLNCRRHAKCISAEEKATHGDGSSEQGSGANASKFAHNGIFAGSVKYVAKLLKMSLGSGTTDSWRDGTTDEFLPALVHAHPREMVAGIDHRFVTC